ncbi:MAG: hypothetical protein IJT12_03965 [Paludibacteraceae bacterium]|nr:hypothetical protein [Paludibacteraceae bacterium]
MAETIFIIVVALLAISFGNLLFFLTLRYLRRWFNGHSDSRYHDSAERENRYDREEREARERYK